MKNNSLKKVLKIMAAISFAASPAYADVDRFISADDASLSFSDYARLTFIDSPFTQGLKMARGDRLIEIPTKGYGWDNPGMRCRFRTDAAEVRVHLYYNEKHCSTSGRNPVGIYLIDGRHEDMWRFTSICQKTVRPPESVIVPISAPSPGMHDYEIVLPYGDSVDVLGISVNDQAHFETPAPRPKPRLVTFGDSITHGFTATVVSRSYAYLLAERKKWQLVNMGIAGSSVSAKEGKLIASLKGDVVCMLSGVNSWQGGASLASYKENVEGFIKNLRAVQPFVPLVIITPLWVPPSWKPVKAAIDLEKYRQALREVVRTMNDENIHLVEGPDLIDHDEKYFDKVAVHPNDDGFAMMAERLANSLKDLRLAGNENVKPDNFKVGATKTGISAEISSRKGSAVFSPQEDMGIVVLVDNLNADAVEIRYTVTVSDSAQGSGISGIIKCPFGKTTFPVSLLAPSAEGVHSVACSFEGLPGKSQNPMMEFVVIDPKYKVIRPPILKKELITEVDCSGLPDSGRYLESGDTSVKETALGHFRYTGTNAKNVFPPLMSVPPDKMKRDNISWFAYRFDVRDVGKPHLLEVTYPDDDLRSFGVSIFQPDSPDAIRGMQINSGVICGGEYPNSGAVKTHRIFFWPISNKAAVVISNRLNGKDAAIGKISLYRLPEGLPECHVTLPEGRKRHLGLFYEEMMIRDNFGGIKSIASPPETRWNGFYKSANNLIEYMKYSGLDIATVMSAGYGDCLFPSDLNEHSGRYNRKLTTDPFQKDLLEMYCSLFDREGLAFIPDIPFGQKKSVFEQKMKDQAIQPSEYYCVDKNGKANENNILETIYDPLSRQWQEYVLSAVKEIAERYKGHPSFSGVEIRMSHHIGGSFCYKNLEYGYGDSVIALFEKETGIKVPGSAENPSRFEERYKFLTSTKREEFIAWRSRKICDFIKNVAAVISSVRSDLKLHLAFMPGKFMPSFRDISNLAVLRDPTFNPTEYMREMGIDMNLFKGISNAVVMKFRRDGGFSTYALFELNYLGQYTREWDSSVEQDNILKRAELPMGVVSYYTYYESRLDDFVCKAQGKWFDFAQVWIVGTHVPTEPYQFEPFAHAMNSYNPYDILWGGFQAPAGREDDMRKFAQAYRSLPAVPFEKLTSSKQPVGIYGAYSDGRGWIYLVNESYAPAQVDLKLTSQEAKAISVTGDERNIRVQDGTANAHLVIDAYSLVVLKADKGQMSVADSTVMPGRFYTDALSSRCQTMLDVLKKSADPKHQILSDKLSDLLAKNLWIDLRATLESAEMFNAFIDCGNSKMDFFRIKKD
jgi:hypothetical protein